MPFLTAGLPRLHCTHRTGLIRFFTLSIGSKQTVLHCARRMSTFLSCAFREQEGDQAAHLFHASKDFAEDCVGSVQPAGVCDTDMARSGDLA